MKSVAEKLLLQPGTVMLVQALPDNLLPLLAELRARAQAVARLHAAPAIGAARGQLGFEPVRQIALHDDWSALRFRRAAARGLSEAGKAAC